MLVLVVGGRFFGHLAARYITHEMDELYATVDEPLDLSEVSATNEGLFQKPSAAAVYEQGPADPSKAKLTDWGDIAAVAPQPSVQTPQQPIYPTQRVPLPSVQLNGDETVNANLQASGMGAEMQQAEGGQIAMISAPVRWLVIRDSDGYKQFKRRARGGYPTVDFAKQMLIVLESDSNFPDNVFEIVSAEKQDGALVVSYRVNVLGLDKKINSHSVLPVDKAQLPIELKQVL